VLNEQHCDTDAAARTMRCSVNALHAVVLASPEAAEVRLSHAEGGIVDVPFDVDCPLFGTNPFVNSAKSAALVDDGNGDGEAGVGDVIRFTVHAENSGTDVEPAVRVVDRLPQELSLDRSSIRLRGEPVSDAVVGPCPSDVTFRLCRSEPSVECLTVDVGDLAPGAANAADLTFDMTVGNSAIGGNGEGSSCNTARIGTVERQAIVDLGSVGFDTAPIDSIRTTGSGGCAVTRSSSSRSGIVDAVVALLAALLAAASRKRARLGRPLRKQSS
jgi:uncharacterized repeat protein (TIGR01451 family)